MLTVLVVGPFDPEIEALASGHPSIEVVRAHGAEDAVEKLGRNRRIDAVLLAGSAAERAAEILGAIREDNPAPPPVFVARGRVEAPAPSGARLLPPGGLAETLERLQKELTAES